MVSLDLFLRVLTSASENTQNGCRLNVFSHRSKPAKFSARLTQIIIVLL